MLRTQTTGRIGISTYSDSAQGRSAATELRLLPSSAAADWLIEHYPAGSGEYGTAFDLMAARSWTRADQRRLAGHYLARLPFASAKPYKVFLSFMAVPVFLSVLEKHLPRDKSGLELLRYHLEPMLVRAAVTDKDRMVVQDFLPRLRWIG